jgi:MSHA biogenesis protein MshP
MKAPANKGMALPMAIFVMVVLSAMVGYLMRIFLLANLAATQEILATRAYFAARAGVEWAAYQVLLPGSNLMQACPADQTLNINGFQVVMVCQQNNYSDTSGTENVSIYQLVATASQGIQGAQDYVERQVQVSLSRCLYVTGGECN